MRRFFAFPGIGCAAGVFGLAVYTATGADLTNVLSAVKDNTMYKPSAQITTTNSNGAGSWFFSGNNNENPPSTRRALIAFDIAGGVPSGSVIKSVSLALNMDKTKSGVDTTTLHRVLANWGEGTSNADENEGKGTNATPGDATWFHRFYSTNLWTTNGGQHLSATSAATAVGNTGIYTWSSTQMVNDVQLWLNTPATNFGWLVRGDESVIRSPTRFGSRENADANKRPKLTVVYEPPAGVGACCFTNGDCLVLSSNDCVGQGGAFGGVGSVCEPNPCPQPPAVGACCLTNGSCVYTTDTACAAMNGTFQGTGVPCASNLCPVVLAPFVDELPIPPIATPVTGSPGGTGHYVMAIQQFGHKMHRDLPTTIVWGVNGYYPGPTMVGGRGQPITVLWSNDLRNAGGSLRTNHYLAVDPCMHGPDTAGASPRIVIHLHGGKVAPDSDGYPEDTLLPGQSDLYYYPNDQRGASTWYHDHALGITRLNVYMGIAGGYVVTDPAEAGLTLPSGARDIPLIVQDRTFNSNGTLYYPAVWQEHFFGDKGVVNGKVWPYLRVERGKYRFRLFNGSTSRTWDLGLSTNAPMWIIGGDGGLLDAPIATNRVLFSPGERVEVVIDFAAFTNNQQILLTNGAVSPYPSGSDVGITNIMKFIVTNAAGYTQSLPAVMATNTPLSESAAVATNTISLQKFSDPCAGSIWLLNSLRWHDITEYPELDTVEVWNFVNRSGVVHPMHLHLVFFQVLDRQAFVISNSVVVPVGPKIQPDPAERGWKDTVRANPDEITRVIARFEGHTGKYPYHCHILEHEDHEMMRQFHVVVSDAPNALPASQVATSSFRAAWSPVETATNYVLDVATNPGFAASSYMPAYSNLAVGPSTSLVVGGLAPNRRHYYRVRSQNPARTSTNSATVEARTLGIYALTVASPYGTAAPPTGSYFHVENTVLSPSVVSPDERGSTQYVAAGWAMAGNSPGSGAGTGFVMTVTNDASLAWLWTTNFRLEVLSPTNGAIDAASGWRAFGSNVMLMATASNYYRFATWSGDVPPAAMTNNPLLLLMDGPKTVGAVFVEKLATNGVPEWWLAFYYPGTNDFDAASLSDTDFDGMQAWAEYVAGTIPTSGASVFVAGGIGPDGMSVEWPSVSGRVYSVRYATNLPAGFALFPDASNLSATPAVNTYTNTTITNAPVLIYRIDVRKE